MRALEQRAADELAARQAGRGTGAASNRNDIRFLTLDEFVVPQLDAAQVVGLDPGASILVAFGPPKSGKTFAMCDLALHAAHGLSWCGFEIRAPLRVAYLAGEGIRGLRARLRAWHSHHQRPMSTNFRILPRAISLPDRVGELAQELSVFEPNIIVTDTLNAFFGRGSENDTEAMTNFVSSIRLLRDELGCSVHVIHHSGLGDQTRERGSNALRASADVMVHIAKDSSGTGSFGFQIVDARDLDVMERPLALRLRQVEIDWKDVAGQQLVSCVVEKSDVEVRLRGSKTRSLGRAQSAVLRIVRELCTQQATKGDLGSSVPRAAISERAKAVDLSRQRVSAALLSLAKNGVICIDGDGVVSLVPS